MANTPTKETKPDDHPGPIIAIALTALVGVVGPKLLAKLERFYFNHFEAIYLFVYALTMGLLGLLLYFILKRTSFMTKRAKLLKSVWHSGPERIFVGKTTDDATPLYLSEKSRTGHVQILGATGRGKTESVIVPWIARDIHRRTGAILIDGKGDPGIIEDLDEITRDLEVPPDIQVLDLGNPEVSYTTNPLAHGSAQQITDRIFTAFDFEDPFYRGVQYRDAGSIVALIHEVDGEEGKRGEVTFRRLYELLTDRNALSEALSRSKDESLKSKLTLFLSRSDKDRERDLMGLVSQIEPLATGEVAVLVNGKVKGKQYTTISEHVLEKKDNAFFAVLLPTLKYQKMGKQLGRLLLQELAWAVGERSSRKGSEAWFTPVFLDEFSAFVYEGFENTLNKARSSQVALHLSHQSIGDLELVNPEFAKIVNTNTNVKCLLGLNDPDTADFFAKHIGTNTEEKLTERAEDKGLIRYKRKTGDISIRKVEAYKIHPNDLKNYCNGLGVLHLPGPNGNITEEVQFARIEGSAA